MIRVHRRMTVCLLVLSLGIYPSLLPMTQAADVVIQGKIFIENNGKISLVREIRVTPVDGAPVTEPVVPISESTGGYKVDLPAEGLYEVVLLGADGQPLADPKIVGLGGKKILASNGINTLDWVLKPPIVGPTGKVITKGTVALISAGAFIVGGVIGNLIVDDKFDEGFRAGACSVSPSQPGCN